jgi:hypothetical protein
LYHSLPSENIKFKIYGTQILPLFLHECRTWSFTFREEQRLREFENKVLRKMSGSLEGRVKRKMGRTVFWKAL